MNRAKGILTGTLLLAGLAAVGGKLGAQLPPPVGERGAMALGPGMDVQFATKVVKGAPFSAQAVTEINQTLSDGNQIHRTASSALCRDSEGRTRREETLGVMGPWISPQGGSEHLVLINDPVAGTHYILNPATHKAHQMGQMRRREKSGVAPGPGSTNFLPPAGSPEARRPRGFEEQIAEEGGTVNKESLGTQTVQGVQAEGTRTTVTLPAGSVGNANPIKVVTEQWYSPALQVVVMSSRTDPRVGETTYRLTNIKQGEPPAEMFQVPGDYTLEEGARPFEMRGTK